MSYNSIFIDLLKYIDIEINTKDKYISCKELCNAMFKYLNDKSALEIITIMKNVIEDENIDRSSKKIASVFLEYTLFVIMCINKEKIEKKEIKEKKEIIDAIDKQTKRVTLAWENFIGAC